MKKSARTITATILVLSGIGVVVFDFSLPFQSWNLWQIITMFVPTLLFGAALILTGWGIIMGDKWRDLLDPFVRF